jgi:predicted nucleic acid-binding protein
VSTLLLDASVWLASRDADDRFHVAARTLVRSAPIGALDLTLYEVANVATVRWHDGSEADRLCRLVRTAVGEERLVRADLDLLEGARRLAELHGISVYDAAYAACATSRGWTLVSGDLRDLVRPGLAIDPDAAVATL